eukprot:gnl/TRDRNA2_/TRDRNA2_125477_c0_seq1.p1 gnl/TRDRNA2_/TRDRNA2_125477_c0~~gnl/TRDRNA2_/TRDRNA2_125477_c0_seq1.p1  ORF type:complete len:686 (-),score=112.16 gnl/TRDRNA2_/TRDRNA2_125477_c0_seq1:205-2169(-)
MLPHRPLLKWLGCKHRSRDLVAAVIPEEVTELVSVFFGSGALEMHLLRSRHGLHVKAFDLDRALMNFWEEMLCEPGEVAWAFEKLVASRVTKKQYYALQQQVFGPDFEPGPIAAAAYFVVNRLCFQSKMTSAFVPSEAKKLTGKIVSKYASSIRNFSLPKGLELGLPADAFETIAATPSDTCLFLDPPYLTTRGTSTPRGPYRKTVKEGRIGNSREYACSPNWGHAEHEALRRALQAHPRWILCHADGHEIRKIYSGFRMLSYTTKGFLNQTTRSELLILSPWVAERVGTPLGLAPPPELNATDAVAKVVSGVSTATTAHAGGAENTAVGAQLSEPSEALSLPVGERLPQDHRDRTLNPAPPKSQVLRAADDILEQAATLLVHGVDSQKNVGKVRRMLNAFQRCLASVNPDIDEVVMRTEELQDELRMVAKGTQGSGSSQACGVPVCGEAAPEVKMNWDWAVYARSLAGQVEALLQSECTHQMDPHDARSLLCKARDLRTCLSSVGPDACDKAVLKSQALRECILIAARRAGHDLEDMSSPKAALVGAVTTACAAVRDPATLTVLVEALLGDFGGEMNATKERKLNCELKNLKRCMISGKIDEIFLRVEVLQERLLQGGWNSSQPGACPQDSMGSTGVVDPAGGRTSRSRTPHR